MKIEDQSQEDAVAKLNELLSKIDFKSTITYDFYGHSMNVWG